MNRLIGVTDDGQRVDPWSIECNLLKSSWKCIAEMYKQQCGKFGEKLFFKKTGVQIEINMLVAVECQQFVDWAEERGSTYLGDHFWHSSSIPKLLLLLPLCGE
ncbi:hypothetical protein Ddc_09211 [Ditylenchus destructor]|nr:hypothetical protein Ddc_09211 [Ditylenchus destructor]